MRLRTFLLTFTVEKRFDSSRQRQSALVHIESPSFFGIFPKPPDAVWALPFHSCPCNLLIASCPYRKSNPDILVMKPAKKWPRQNAPWVWIARDAGASLTQRKMCSSLIVIIRISPLGDLRHNTLSWCRRTRVSVSREKRERNSPVRALQSTCKDRPWRKSIVRFVITRQPDWICLTKAN